MKALILASGMGTRISHRFPDLPKCLVPVHDGKCILEMQLEALRRAGVDDVIVTTGYRAEKVMDFVKKSDIMSGVTFVHSDRFAETNYIYSIYLAGKLLNDDMLLMHGDLVFEYQVLERLLKCTGSGVIIERGSALKDADFKGEMDGDCVKRIGVDVFGDTAVNLLPLYRWNKCDFTVWLQRIEDFVDVGRVNCYAEDAFNEISDTVCLHGIDCGEFICAEVDTEEDLNAVRTRMEGVK